MNINTANLFLAFKKFLKYTSIGAASTLIHICIASLYLLLVKDALYESNILGFLIAFVFSYTMQSKMVFKQKISKKKALKYFIVQLFALLLSLFITNVFNDYNNYIKTIIVIILMPLITFTLHQFWTFKNEI